jgi:putative glycosyltransferase (TIGR04372 family)
LQPYNYLTYFLKYIDKKNISKIIFSIFISLYLLLIIIYNLPNFRKTNKVFINSYAFGHSVTESSIFFYEYGYKAICISVGNRKNRNKYLKQLFRPYILIHFWLPSIKDINIYHGLRFRTHKNIDLFLQKSKLIKIILRKNLSIISREDLCTRAAVRNLQRDYRLTEKSAITQVDNFNAQYMKTESIFPLTALHYLVQQETLVRHSLPPKIIKLNGKFLTKAKSFKMNYSDAELKICTIVLRRSWKPWSGQGLDSYYQAIDYLHSKNYIINLIGDLDDRIKLKNDQSLGEVYWHKDYNLNSKIFQILSIINSSFCIGDQSGIQALIHFLGTENLIINSVPFGQLQYNSVILPRIWCNENGMKADIKEHFNSLFYRYHALMEMNGSRFSPQYYSPETILDAVENFVENYESHYQIMKVFPKKFVQDPNCMSLFSKNSTYSPILFKKLES